MILNNGCGNSPMRDPIIKYKKMNMFFNEMASFKKANWLLFICLFCIYPHINATIQTVSKTKPSSWEVQLRTGMTVILKSFSLLMILCLLLAEK